MFVRFYLMVVFSQDMYNLFQDEEAIMPSKIQNINVECCLCLWKPCNRVLLELMESAHEFLQLNQHV